MKKFLVLPLLIFLSLNVSAEEYVWDFLRPVSEFAQSIDFPVKVVVFLLAVAIFIISVLAYSKSKSKRILLVAFAFFLFSLKWLVQIIDIFYSPGDFLSKSSENIFELGIMLSLLVAIFYRKSWRRFFEKDFKN